MLKSRAATEVETPIHALSRATCIELITADDPRLAQIIPVLNEGFVDIYHRFNYQDQPETRANLLKVIRKYLSQPEGVLAVVVEDNQIIGYCITGRRENDVTGFTVPFIYGLWIRQNHRGNLSTVRQLVRLVLQELGKRGHPMAAAQINIQNPVVIAAKRMFRIEKNSFICVFPINRKGKRPNTADNDFSQTCARATGE